MGNQSIDKPDVCVPGLQWPIVTEDPSIPCNKEVAQKLDGLLMPGMLTALEDGRGCCLTKYGEPSDTIFAKRIEDGCIQALGDNKASAKEICKAIQNTFSPGSNASVADVWYNFKSWATRNAVSIGVSGISSVLGLVGVYYVFGPKIRNYNKRMDAKEAEEARKAEEAQKKADDKDDGPDDTQGPSGGIPASKPVVNVNGNKIAAVDNSSKFNFSAEPARMTPSMESSREGWAAARRRAQSHEPFLMPWQKEAVCGFAALPVIVAALPFVLGGGVVASGTAGDIILAGGSALTLASPATQNF